MKCLLSLIVATFLHGVAFPQKIGGQYPQGYFRYPLDIAPRLNANFGEMRPNHFHMGLDLFTLRKENLPILAAADGYIARVKIEPGGFGNAIYINHPNGFTTLYAHMNDFMPALQQYVRQQQYSAERWEQDLGIPAGRFPVKKGEFIGYSGNTGGSQGPHVHFEIRETASEKCLNPLLFGFSIPDNVPPVIHKIAIYNRDQSVYEQTPVVVAAQRSTEGYRALVPRLKFRNLLIAVQATDQMSGVPNSNGIYKATLYEGSTELAGFTIDGIGYDQTRFLNAHIDYRTKLSGGSYLQFLTPLTGDGLSIYKQKPGSHVELRDMAPHPFRLEVRDPQSNASSLYFTLQRSEENAPREARAGNLMRPGEINVFENENVEMYLPENALYDSVYFRYAVVPGASPEAYSPVHSLHTDRVPLHVPCTVRIRPDRTIPYNLRDRMLIRVVTRGNRDVRKANWEMGKYVAAFRDLGTFQLVADDKPPVLSGIEANADVSRASKIVVRVQDDNDDVANFRAELDGNWIRFVQRGNSFTYVMDEKCPPGEHELKISVYDIAGNNTTRVYKIKR
jgi:murein DD-endopeptidase MepM/ murein hydrolase activator NlpD